MKTEEIDELLLNIDEQPIIIEDEVKELIPIIKDFVETFVQNQNQPIDQWMNKKIHNYLPEKNLGEIESITTDIINTIKLNQEKQESLEKAIQSGQSKENWFATDIKKSTSYMTIQDSGKYLTQLDTAIKNANESLSRTILTQAGTINNNPRLDGFIAEQYHAQTFNLNAKASGSQYYSEVLEPIGQGYTKNSVDLVIKDAQGKVVKRYQSKYGKDANATRQSFEKGDYRGQQKLVPDGQENLLSKKATNIIEAPDGTTSTPLSKRSAEQLRDDAQSGKWKEMDWNQYNTKDLAMGIGRKTGEAALQGAVISVGMDIAQKLYNGEKINGEEVVETALRSGTDVGIKAAVSGAIKVGAEKGIITAIPKSTPVGTITNIVHVGIENAKIVGKMASGELSFKDGMNKMEQVTVSTVSGIAASVDGAAIGATIGSIFGPVGTAIGGFVGGTIGYMAGSKVGETVVKGAQKLREGAKKVIKSTGDTIKSIGSSIGRSVSSFVSSVSSFFSKW